MHDTRIAVKVQGQEVKVTAWDNVQKFAKLSARDCSISLKFRSPEIWYTTNFSRSVGQRLRSQHDITYQHKKRCSGTDKLSKVKLGENYPRAERNT